MCFLLLVFVGMRKVDRFAWFGFGWVAMVCEVPFGWSDGRPLSLRWVCWVSGSRVCAHSGVCHDLYTPMMLPPPPSLPPPPLRLSSGNVWVFWCCVGLNVVGLACGYALGLLLFRVAQNFFMA